MSGPCNFSRVSDKALMLSLSLFSFGYYIKYKNRNRNKHEKNIKLKKLFMVQAGFDPTIFGLRVRRPTDCATGEVNMQQSFESPLLVTENMSIVFLLTSRTPLESIS